MTSGDGWTSDDLLDSLDEAAFGPYGRPAATAAEPAALAESGGSALGVSDAALDALGEAAFGPMPGGKGVTQAALDEVQRLVESGFVSSQSDEIEEVTGQIADLARSRLGMSEQRARLFAQGDVLTAREYAASLEETVTELRRRRDEMEGWKPWSDLGAAMVGASSTQLVEAARGRRL